MAGTWDVVFGADAYTINSVIARLFQIAHPLFNPRIQVNGPGFTAVQINLGEPPSLDLEPPAAYLDLASSHAAEIGYTGGMDAAVAAMTGGSGTLSFAQVQFVLLNQNQPIGGGDGTMTCNIAFFSDGSNLWASISDLTATVENDPQLNALLAQYVDGAVLDYFAANLFEPLRLPISLPFGNFAIPVINSEAAGPAAELVAYTGLQPVTLPTQLAQWPPNAAFLALDSTVLTAVARQYMPNPTGSGGIPDPNFSWDYSVGMVPTIQVEPGGGGQIAVPFTVGGSAAITYHTPNGLPNISLGAGISGSAVMQAAITAQPTGNNGMALDLSIGPVGDFDLSLDISGVPSIIGSLINDIISPLLDEVAGAVSDFLQGKSYTLDNLPALTVSFPTGPVTFFLAPVQVQSIPGPDGVPVMALFGQVQLNPG